MGSQYRLFCRSSLVHYPKYSKQFSVEPFGKLEAPLGMAADVKIVPLDPVKYPMQNQAFIEWDVLDSSVDSSNFICQQDKSSLSLSVGNTSDGNGVTCTAKIPIKFDVFVQHEGKRNVSIEALENDSIQV